MIDEHNVRLWQFKQYVGKLGGQDDRLNAQIFTGYTVFHGLPLSSQITVKQMIKMMIGNALVPDEMGVGQYEKVGQQGSFAFDVASVLS